MSTHAGPTVLKPSAENVDLLDLHPVVRNRAHLPTPPIQRAYSEISEAVAEHDAGISFVAFSRFGKTFAIEVLSAQLSASFPNVPVLCTNAKEHGRYSEATFFAEVLEGCTRTPVPRDRAPALRNRLVRFLWALAESKSSDRIVLFVDEAQNWTQAEFTALRDISNDLVLLADVHLIVNLFGAPALANTRGVLLQAGRTDLVGRFMVRQFEFQGIGSLSDLMETMRCYDDVNISEYPANSGVSYTEFFMPLAFRDGWRLEQEAPILWECFQNVAMPHGGVKQIGMRWVASTIRKFLMSHCEWDRAGFRGDPKTWQAAIIRSGFAQTLGVTYSASASLAAAAPAEPEKTAI